MSDAPIDREESQNANLRQWGLEWAADRIDAQAARIAALEAEREKLRELIFGVGVNLWDRAELSERDEAGNQTILLWHPSGMPVASLRVHQYSADFGAMHVELLMSDLLDVFMARERAALAETEGWG